MDKLAAEKIAHEYFQVGVELALQDAGLGMNKTASRGKNIAKMLGLGGAGALGGAALMKAIAPEASESVVRTMAKKSPLDFVKAMYHIPGERLGIADARARQMVANADLNNMDLLERFAATQQALKPSNLEDMFGNMGRSVDDRARQLLAKADPNNMGLSEHLAATQQALKPSNLEDMLVNKGLDRDAAEGVFTGLGKGLSYLNPVERLSDAGASLSALKDYIY